MNKGLDNTPNHVAIIMDGNGRWAKLKGKDRLYGHKNGIKSVQKTQLNYYNYITIYTHTSL